MQFTPDLGFAVEVVLSLNAFLPEIEITQHPVLGILGLHEINQAGSEPPVLVRGNAFANQDVLMAILSTTTEPFYLLFCWLPWSHRGYGNGLSNLHCLKSS
jgi:hypothetical protein